MEQGGIFLNIAVVDDLSVDRTQLSQNIGEYGKRNKILIETFEYKSGEEFLAQAPLSKLDAVFLDIYMGGQSGMDVARKLKVLNSACKIIFVTTSPAFAVESYDVGAFYYLLKPCTLEQIGKVIERLDKILKKSSRYIIVKEGREWRKIFLGDILYVDYRNHYVQIHTHNGVISTYMKFPEIQGRLGIYEEFLNCYRCIVVNMNKVSKVEDYFFLMVNGEYVPINRKSAKTIKAQYVDYVLRELEKTDVN